MTEERTILERANEVMDNAVDVAGEMLTSKPQVAEIILKQLLKCDPEHLSGLQLLGLCKHRMGQHAEAIEIFQTAIELDPTSADNYNNIGLAYSGLENHERAIEAIKKAIELKPEQYLFYNNLALQYRCLEQYDKAIECMNKALAINEIPQMLVNLGGVYGEMKMVDKSRECFERACAIAPNYAAAHVDMAFCYHLEGRWEEGFKEYEWRFDYYPQLTYYLRSYDQNKRWDGKASLEGKRILIYAEQGMGDAIQFVRYLKQLKQRGAHVILHCAAALDDMLRRCEGVDETCNRDIVNCTGKEFPPYDYQCAIMSLPTLLGDYSLRGEPYIKAVTPKFLDHMKKEYGDTVNVGIVWAGSPSHPHDKRRSIPLKHFRVLHDLPGVKLFNLQLDMRPRQYGVTTRSVGNGEEDNMVSEFQPNGSSMVNFCDDCEGMTLVDLTKMIQTWEDTATILAGLDLVICCDTAVGHLAGAMGVPCWMALPYNPDWRWTYDGEASGWYDSVKLYRQRVKHDWPEVFQRLRTDLQAMVESRKA